jgi:hypothetical protein
VRLKLFQQVQCAESAQTVETVLIDVMARSTQFKLGVNRIPENA